MIRCLHMVIVCSLLIAGISMHAQLPDSIGVSYPSPKHFGGHFGPLPKGGYSRDEIRRTRAWHWEFLGPSAKPAELNPGGKAVPGYSENRGNGTGRINYLYIHPRKKNRLWACSPTGGLWFTRDGEHWHEGGTDQLPISGVSSVAVNPKNSRQWIVATGDGDDVFRYSNGLWRTTNAGRSYEKINGDDPSTALPIGLPGDFYSQISEVVCHPRDFHFLLAATDQGLWMCEDASSTSKMKWKRVHEGHFYDIEIFRSSEKSWYMAAGGNKLLISADGGNTWKNIPVPEYPELNKFPFLRLSVEHSPDDPDHLFVALTCSEAETMSAIGEASLYRVDIHSHKWSFIRSLKKEMNNMMPTRARALAVSPTDANHILCGNVQPVFISRDGGVTFTKISKNQMHDDYHHFVFAGDGKTVWCGHDGGVSRSNDGGLTWLTADNGIGAANVFGVSVAQTPEPQVLYGAYDTGGNLLRHGKWYHTNWGDGFTTIIHPDNPDIMFATSQNGGLYKSVEPGNFEEPTGSKKTKTEWHTWIDMHTVDHNTIYCSGSQLVRSRDLGKTWEPILDIKDIGEHVFNVYRFFLSDPHPGVMYVTVLSNKEVRPEIWRTFNVNEADPTRILWEKLPDLPSMGWVSAMVVDPGDPKKFYTLFSNRDAQKKLWYWSGSDYVDETRNLGHCLAESMILQRGSSQRIYIGTDYGVFTRSRGETEWTLLTGLPGVDVRSLDINYKDRKLIAGTYGRGIWSTDLVD